MTIKPEKPQSAAPVLPHGSPEHRSAQPLASRKPMFWVRLCSNDGYEGPIHNDRMEEVRKRSGAWSPLYIDPPPDEMSPDFTDTARAALLWLLWHHQGASSPVGQPIRFALGIGQHDRLNDHQLREAKRWEALHPVNPSVWAQCVRPLTTEQITALWVEHGLDECDPEGFARHIEAAHGITGATDGKPK